MKRLIAIITLCILLPTWANAEDDILTTAAANGSFKTLTNLIVAADLDEALQGKGSFTVFAPTDEAFARLPKGTLEELLKPKNREKLADILKFHMIPEAISIAKSKPSHPVTTAKTLLGKKLNFKRDGEMVEVNGIKVITRNIRCSNGIIQVIDGVLIPSISVDSDSLLGVAKQAGTFKTLLAAVDAADLTEVLQGDGPFTLFAPTDKAFAKLPKGTIASLLKPDNKEKLATILKYRLARRCQASRYVQDVACCR